MRGFGSWMAGALLVLTACGVFTGCEDSPDTEHVDLYFDDAGTVDSTADRPPVEAARMQVTPETVAVTTNGAVAQFSVEGATDNVHWSVQDATRGEILTQSRISATYRRTAAGDNVVIATDRLGMSAFAVVTQP